MNVLFSSQYFCHLGSISLNGYLLMTTVYQHEKKNTTLDTISRRNVFHFFLKVIPKRIEIKTFLKINNLRKETLYNFILAIRLQRNFSSYSCSNCSCSKSSERRIGIDKSFVYVLYRIRRIIFRRRSICI